MFRKLSLAVVGCMALVALGALAPSAFAADPGCNGNNLSLGIYKDTLVQGLDLAFDDAHENATTGVSGGAILCGTDDVNDRYFTNGHIKYPNLGEIARCARPNSAIGPCADGNIEDGRYSGGATSDVYCDAGVCALFGAKQNDDVPTETHVRYNTSGPGSGPDRCDETSTTLVGCFESEATLLGIVNCDTDIIITKGASGYKMTIYQPTCDTGAEPTYFDTIDDLTICEYAGAVEGTSCGTDPNLWLNKNGSNNQPGPTNWKFQVSAPFPTVVPGHKVYVTGFANGQWIDV